MRSLVFGSYLSQKSIIILISSSSSFFSFGWDLAKTFHVIILTANLSAFLLDSSLFTGAPQKSWLFFSFSFSSVLKCMEIVLGNDKLSYLIKQIPSFLFGFLNSCSRYLCVALAFISSCSFKLPLMLIFHVFP